MAADSGGKAIDKDTKRRLEQSVKNGNEESVVEILDQIGWDIGLGCLSFQYDVSRHANDEGSLLHLACFFRRPKLVELLLERNASCDKETTKEHSSPLHLSAERGDEESCRLLISYRCTVDAVDAQKQTPLHRASCEGHTKVVELLTADERAAINHKDSRGWRPVHQASHFGRTGVVQLLANRSADINCKDNHGETPLMVACNRSNTDTARLLVKLGADITIANRNGHTVLYHAVQKGEFQTARRLLSNLTDPCSIKNALGKHLHLALKQSNMKLLAFICAHGALEVANDEEKANVRQFAKDHCDALSTSRRGRTPASTKLQTALSKAVTEKKTYLATVLVSVEMDVDSSKDIADALQLAEKSESIELALAVLSSCRCKLDDVKLITMRSVLELALRKASLKLTLVACEAGALIGAGSQDMNNVLALALDEASAELALIACKAFDLSSGCVPKFSPKMVTSALHLGLETDCLELLLLTCTCAANSDLRKIMGQRLDELLQFAERRSSVELAAIVCQAVPLASAKTASDVLALALVKKSVELALIVCKASVLPGDDPNIAKAAQLALDTMSAELATAACERGALNTASLEATDKLLRLEFEKKYVNLLLAVTSATTAVAAMERALLWDVLQFALQLHLIELVLNVCRAGALDGVKEGTTERVLKMALKEKSVELALIACKANVLSKECTPDLIQATAQLALDTDSAELAIVACQGGALTTDGSKLLRNVMELGLQTKSIQLMLAAVQMSDAGALTSILDSSMAADILRTGLEFTSVELVLAVASKTKTLASKENEQLASRLLEFAAQQGSAELASIACGTGVIESADAKKLDHIMEVALGTSSTEVISTLVGAGALQQQNNDKVKEEVLRQAAITGDLKLAEHCISIGTLHTADHWGEPTPVDIARKRGHSRLAETLRKALDNHNLLSLEQQAANTVLIRVVGSPGAGKSTLVESLTISGLWRIFRRESQPDEGDANYQKRTRGIQVVTYTDSSDTVFRILDLGGQDDFAAANQLFIGEGKIPVINLIVISLLKTFAEMQDEVMKWSAFFASRCDSSIFGQKPEHYQPVIVVATRSESKTENAGEKCPKGSEHGSRILRKVPQHSQHSCVCRCSKASGTEGVA